MTGNEVNEQMTDNSEDKSDGSESEEEVVSLVILCFSFLGITCDEIFQQVHWY